MNSYIRFIGSGRSPWNAWFRSSDVDVIDTLQKKASDTDLLRFILDQTLMLSELIWLYGPRGHEYITSYASAIKEFTNTTLSKIGYDGIHGRILKDIRNIQSVMFGGEWIDVDINTINVFLFELCQFWKKCDDRDVDAQTHPMSCTPGMIIPYLMHRNRHVDSRFKTFAGNVYLPSIYMCSNVIMVSETCVGTQFFARFEDRYNQKQRDLFYQFRRYSVLTFLSKTVMTNIRYFDEVLRYLAAMCFHGDVTRIICSNFKLFYAAAVVLHDIIQTDFLDIARVSGRFPIRTHAHDFALHEDVTGALFALLTLLHQDSGLQMSCKWIFTKFFSANIMTKNCEPDVTKIIELVAADKNGTVATESIDAFKRFTGLDYSMEAINLISRHTTASTQEPGTDETIEEPEIEPDPEFETFDDLFTDDAGPSLEAEGAEGEPSDAEDDDSTAEDDDVTDDPSSGDNNEGNDNPDNPDGDNAEGSAATDVPSGTTDNNNSQVNTQTTGEPEHVEASDDEGIEIRFVTEGSETVESVTLREEIDQFLSEVLINPPKKLSQQTVSALTALQKYCVHLLSVETIVGILGMLIELPEKFKTIKNSHGENS